ncbi:MAG: heavy metal resistance protein [Opitutus sp.]|nr:heavy metal resistance protein [Opitutus sp.]
MKPWARNLLFLLSVAAIAAGAAAVTEFWMRRSHPPEDAHAWVHRQLEITPEQDRRIAEMEKSFAQRRAVLMRRLHEANEELANAILEDRATSPKVGAVVRRIHSAQAELQQITLDHVFEMRAALTPAQYDKLLRLTADALTRHSH